MSNSAKSMNGSCEPAKVGKENGLVRLQLKNSEFPLVRISLKDLLYMMMTVVKHNVFYWNC